MRAWNLIKGDVKFVNKYGINAVYVIFTLVYLGILELIKGDAKGITAAILIYTDPAAMGLFFMGAILMLEKSQRVNCSLSVTPITVSEYIVSKILALLIPGTIVAVFLCIFASPEHIWTVIPTVMISSAIFSLCGLIATIHSKSLNGFIIAVIPFEIVIMLPAIYSIFVDLSAWYYLLHPGIAAMRLIRGDMQYWYVGVPAMLIWLVIAFCMCHQSVQKYFVEMGGGKIQ